MTKNLSSEYVDPKQIQQLTKRVSKMTNHHYRSAIDRRKTDSFAEREQKVFKKLRPLMGEQSYKDERMRFWGMHKFQQQQFIEHWEIEFERRRTS